MKKTIGVLMVVGAFGLGLAACGDKGSGTTGGSASPGSSGAPKSGGAAGNTGIKECDDLIKKIDETVAEMKKCKIPEAGKAGWDAGIKTMEDSKKTWNDSMKAAADDVSKKAAAEGCKGAMAGIVAMPCPAM